MTRQTYLAGAAVLALVVIGGAAFVVTRPEAPAPAPAVAAHAGHDEHGEEDHEEGEVDLNPAQRLAAGITVVTPSRGGGAEARLAGRVAPMPDARAAVAAPVSGSVERVLVAPGQSVRAGQALAVLISGDAAALRADVEAAAAAASAARQAHDRDQSLFEQGVVARQEVEASRARALGAEAAARAAQARARASGNPDASGRLSITSPIAGVVTALQTGPGGFVAQGGAVAEVANPARLELVFSAPPAIADQARAGSTLRVAGPAGEFSAVVTGVVAGAGDSGASLIRARSAGVSPPAGSAVSGVLITGEAGALTVPSEAVQTVEGGTVVFIETPHGFRAAPVMAGRQASGRTEIVSGLAGGERIAASGAFLLKAELSKGEAEHHHH